MRFVKDLAKFTITYVLTWSTYILTRPKVGTTYSIATQTQKKKKKNKKKLMTLLNTFLKDYITLVINAEISSSI